MCYVSIFFLAISIFCGFSPEIKIVEPSLKIICPKSGYVLYNCFLTKNFKSGTWTNEILNRNVCTPANENVVEFPLILEDRNFVGKLPTCPAGSDDAAFRTNEKSDFIYTDHGWLTLAVRK